MKRLMLLAALLVGADAWAQSASDLPTTETQSSSQAGLPTTQTQSEPPAAAGGARAYYPGMPLPQPPQQGEAAGKPGGKESERQGLILTDEDRSGDYDTGVSVAPGAPPAEIPDTHTVQKGDTLWDLSSRYYRNAWGWPKMWSYNPQITNPHWIYPGDVIRLLPPGGEPAPAPAPTAKTETALGTTRIVGRSKGPTGIFLRQNGFVEPGELAQAGKIVGSKEEKLMLGTLDEAYVKFTKERPFQVGERYTIYQPTQAVKHPLTGKYLGHMVEIFGEGEVRAVTDGKIARIAIVDSVNPIERGFLVGPLKRQFKVVQPVTDKADLSGIVVATLLPHELLGADNIVFIDKGKDDGVQVGNRFLVTRRGDGYQPLLSSGPMDDKRFPRENIGELLVVDVRDHISTCFMTHSTVEARVGDRVEARRGF